MARAKQSSLSGPLSGGGVEACEEGAFSASSTRSGHPVPFGGEDQRALLFTSFDRRPDEFGDRSRLCATLDDGGGSGGGLVESEARALRVVGSFGDSTWFGADLDAARAAAEATAAAAQAVPLSEKYRAQFECVRDLLIERRLFTDEAVQTYLSDYYNNLGLNEFYFQTAAPERIADNLLAVIAAKTLHVASKSDYFPEIIQIDEASGDVFTMAMASLTNRKASQNYKVEKRIEREYLNLDEPKKPCMRMQCYRSSGSVFAENERDTERIRTYFLQMPKYPFDAESLSPTETDIRKLVDADFYSSKFNTVTAGIFSKLNAQVVQDSSNLGLFVNVVPRGDGFRLDVAFRRGPQAQEFFSRMGDCITLEGFYSKRKYVEPLANGVTIFTAFIENLPLDEFPASSRSDQERVVSLVEALRMQFVLPKIKLLDLVLERLLTIPEAAYAVGACQFALHFSATVGDSFPHIEELVQKFGGSSLTQQEVYEVRTRLKQCPFTETSLFEVCKENPEIIRRLYALFQRRFDPRLANAKNKAASEAVFAEEEALRRQILSLDSPEAVPVFLKFLQFNRHILKTNFYIPLKIGLGFRLSPDYLSAADFNPKPYAVYMQISCCAIGFHFRCTDVARGGVRVLQSVGVCAYDRNKRNCVDEVFNLAFTQQFKNKDISEGGSKGIVLLNKASDLSEAQRLTPLGFKAYVDNMLDLLLPNPFVVDYLGAPEVCFLGPDENTGTGGLVDWAALRAKQRGAWFWKAFTTGKKPEMGGIPHDVFGMTTASVETYVRGIYEKLGLKEEEVSRIQTGGPDGDLGCNALLQSKSKTIAVVDGSGVLYDPQGLDAEELRRLARLRFVGGPTSAMAYDDKLLSPKGFKVPQDARDITLPDGTRVASGFEFRNTFHLSRFAESDLFNPCGGRPASINPQNVSKLFDEQTGHKKFKFIVEGANVFITDDARRILEKKGVILFKDASTNKGGVTSSSLEVLAALALNEAEFDTHMRVTDPQNPPAFYKAYVQAILGKIRENARLEFEALWNEGIRTGLLRCDLTDILSKKINDLKREISKSSSLWRDEELVDFVLKKALPDVLVPGLLSVQTLRERVPDAYLRALVTGYLASRFYYSQQFASDVSAFAFLSYLDDLRQEMRRADKHAEANSSSRREA